MACRGGSTIEQQLAKHLIGDFSRTLDRKFEEAFVAIRLEKALTKDQIMNYYLNRIYFGKGVLRSGGGGARLLQQGCERPDAAGMRAAGGDHSLADKLVAADGYVPREAAPGHHAEADV